MRYAHAMPAGCAPHGAHHRQDPLDVLRFIASRGFGGGPGRGFGPGRPGRGGWGGRGPRAKRGDIRLAALLLLAEEPRNGYAIMQAIEERTEGVWRPSPGSVYPALNQLQDEGLVQIDEGDGKRTFSLTDAGRADIEARGDVTPPWVAVTEDVDSDAWALMAQMGEVGAALHQVSKVGTPEQVAAARRILQQTRQQLYGLLAEEPPA